jgi:type I restriction enzyme, S subunit
MSKQEKKGLVPELRFPEFRDKGEWELAPLKKLASKRTERNRDGKLVRVLTNSAEHGVVDQRDYFDKDIATQGNLENYFIVDKGDFVYNPRISAFAPVGPISNNSVAKGVMSPLYTVFRFRNSNIDFYAHYFKTSAWHLYMRQIGSTGARHDRMAITNDDFLAMPLPVPSPKEQQKIADFLASIDELITAQIQKLAALKTHKKGLMQQLFPAEGETVPKLRFPEFLDKGKWEDKRLEYVAPLQRGFDLPTHQLELGDVPVVYSNGVQNYHKEGMAKGPGLVTGRSGTIGKLNFIEAGDYWPHNTTLWVTSFKDNIPKFIYFLYATIGMERFASGSGVPTLNRNDVHAFNAYIPQLKDEQQKIADCLTSLDDLITAQTKKIETLKAHKKGLMQELFPAMDEVAA